MEFDESLLIQRTKDVKLDEEREQRFTLHCQHCNTVLGDSLSICGEIKSMDSIMCLRVTNDVVVSDAVESVHKGEMANCIYSSLKCRCCCSALGKVIHSAPSHLAPVRSLFLLCKANISCYILNSSSLVKASTLSFDLMPISVSMNELRQQIEAQLDRMARIKSRLAVRKKCYQ